MLRGIIEIYVINRIIPSTNLAPYSVHPNPKTHPGFEPYGRCPMRQFGRSLSSEAMADAKYEVAVNFFTTMLDRSRLRDSYSNE